MTGNPLLDELRAECHKQNIKMADLDEFVRSRRYFRNKGWRGSRGAIRYEYIVRAIYELGGKLVVEWCDE